MTWISLFTLFFTGIIAGFINIISAGGSLITLPALIFLGLPSAMANGTNRMAILVQNLFAFIEFYRKGLIKWKLSFLLSVPAVIGSLIGAALAVDLPDNVFNNTMAIIMVIVILLILFKPQQYVRVKNPDFTLTKAIILFISFLIVGFYGGFIQAGVGFLIIAFLTLFASKLSLVEMHSIKTVVVTFYLLISTIIFIIHGQVNWLYAVVLAFGSGIGGWLGSKFAIKVSEKVLKITMTVVIFAMAIIILFF